MRSTTPAPLAAELIAGPLRGSFPILSLRTNKADVIVGVEKETAEKLDRSGEKWRVNGKCVCVSSLLYVGAEALVQVCDRVVLAKCLSMLGETQRMLRSQMKQECMRSTARQDVATILCQQQIICPVQIDLSTKA